MKLKRVIAVILLFILFTAACSRKNERGGFKDYLPLPELPGNARIILQLQKK